MRESALFNSERLHLALLVICGFPAVVLIFEIVVRVAGEADADGQFTCLGYELPPYALPFKRIRPIFEAYFNNPDETVFIPDPATGWIHRPDTINHDGMFTVNGISIRSRRE